MIEGSTELRRPAELGEVSDPFDIKLKQLISASLISTEMENETNKLCDRLLSSGSNHMLLK